MKKQKSFEKLRIRLGLELEISKEISIPEVKTGIKEEKKLLGVQDYFISYKFKQKG